MWKNITGYKWPYRISDEGVVQKYANDQWITLKPYLGGGRRRVMVKMRTADNKKVDVPIVWLMADAFMGGRKPGYAIIHKDGAKFNCAFWNLEFRTMSEAGKLSGQANRKNVLKIDPLGNVITVYRSVTEAAKKEYISKNSISLRCLNQVQHPFDLTGYNYQYER